MIMKGTGNFSTRTFRICQVWTHRDKEKDLLVNNFGGFFSIYN